MDFGCLSLNNKNNNKLKRIEIDDRVLRYVKKEIDSFEGLSENEELNKEIWNHIHTYQGVMK